MLWHLATVSNTMFFHFAQPDARSCSHNKPKKHSKVAVRRKPDVRAALLPFCPTRASNEGKNPNFVTNGDLQLRRA